MTATEWPQGYHRIVLDSVDSTNAEALRRLPGLNAPAWIFARTQTAGRGRRGRGWASPAGNFSATLLMRPGGTPAEAALRSFIASRALYDALVAVTGQPERFALKWPNDVLLDGGKLAGILLESMGQGAQTGYLAIGIGVNLGFVPEGGILDTNALHPVCLREATGTEVDPVAFLNRLAVAFDGYERQFRQFGFAPIRSAWLQHAARIGDRITARTTRDTHEGIFEDVDPNGNLVLRTATGPLAIAAADVFF